MVNYCKWRSNFYATCTTKPSKEEVKIAWAAFKLGPPGPKPDPDPPAQIEVETPRPKKDPPAQTETVDPPAQTEEKDFSYRGKRCLLTIHRHITLEDIHTMKLVLFPDKSFCKGYNEVGKTGHEHAHVLLVSRKRMKLTSKKRWKKFRELIGKFHLKPIQTAEHYANVIGYEEAEKKKGNPVDIVYDDIPLEFNLDVPYHIQVLQFIQSQKTWRDVMNSTDHSIFISARMSWARQVYDAKPTKIEIKDRPLRWFQEYFLKVTDLPPDDRTVHWLADPSGDMGKSELVNMLINKGAFFFDGGKTQDVMYAYDGQPIVVVDLPRSSADFIPYRLIEMFKNKRAFSSKYVSCSKAFKVPHILVFANFAPDLSELTEDRWIIYGRDVGHTLKVRTLHSSHHMFDQEPEPEFLKLRELMVESKLLRKGCPNNVKAPPGLLAQFVRKETKKPDIPVFQYELVPFSPRPKAVTSREAFYLPQTHDASRDSSNCS